MRLVLMLGLICLCVSAPFGRLAAEAEPPTSDPQEVDDRLHSYRLTLAEFFSAAMARGLPMDGMFEKHTYHVVGVHMKHRDRLERVLADAVIDGVPEEMKSSFIGVLIRVLGEVEITCALTNPRVDLRRRTEVAVNLTRQMRGSNRPVEQIVPLDWATIRHAYIDMMTPILDEVGECHLAAQAEMVIRVIRIVSSAIDQASNTKPNIPNSQMTKVLIYGGYLERCRQAHVLIDVTWEEYGNLSPRERLLYQVCHLLSDSPLQDMEPEVLDEAIVQEGQRLIAPLTGQRPIGNAHKADALLVSELIEAVWSELGDQPTQNRN